MKNEYDAEISTYTVDIPRSARGDLESISILKLWNPLQEGDFGNSW